MDSGNEYEPGDSRNVTGTARTADGRWTNKGDGVVPGVPDGHPFTAEEAASSAAKSNSDEAEDEAELAKQHMDEGSGNEAG